MLGSGDTDEPDGSLREAFLTPSPSGSHSASVQSQALCSPPRSPAQQRTYHGWGGPSGLEARLPLLLGGPALLQVLGCQLPCSHGTPGVISGSESLQLLHLSPGVRPLKKSVLQTALGPEDWLACFPPLPCPRRPGRALQSAHIVPWSQGAHPCASLSQRPSWEPAACREAPPGLPILAGLRNAAMALGDSLHSEAC